MVPLLFFRVAPHLSSQGMSGPRSRPTGTQKIWQHREWKPVPLGLQPESLTIRPQRRSIITEIVRKPFILKYGSYTCAANSRWHRIYIYIYICICRGTPTVSLQHSSYSALGTRSRIARKVCYIPDTASDDVIPSGTWLKRNHVSEWTEMAEIFWKTSVHRIHGLKIVNIFIIGWFEVFAAVTMKNLGCYAVWLL
jgi:hypothetical protein